MIEASAPVAIYSAAATTLFAMALHAFIARAHLMRRLIALNIMSSSVFLILVAIARRTSGEAPDPVPHAMVLTGIVVAVSATAFALVLVRRIHDATGRADLPDDRPEDA